MFNVLGPQALDHYDSDSSLTSSHLSGMKGQKENADADGSSPRGGGRSQVEIDNVIL